MAKWAIDKIRVAFLVVMAKWAIDKHRVALLVEMAKWAIDNDKLGDNTRCNGKASDRQRQAKWLYSL